MHTIFHALREGAQRIVGAIVIVTAFCVVLSASAQSTDDMYGRIADQVPEFGGMYYVGEVLHVNMTEQTPELQERVATVIGTEFAVVRDDRPTIVFNDAHYGFNELRGWYADLRNTAFSYDFVTGTDIDEKNNRIEIAIESEENRATLEQAFQNSGVPEDAVLIIIMSRFETDDEGEKSIIPIMSILTLFGAMVLVLVWRFALRRS